MLIICNFSYFPFWFEGWIWVLIDSVPDICILFTSLVKKSICVTLLLPIIHQKGKIIPVEPSMLHFKNNTKYSFEFELQKIGSFRVDSILIYFLKVITDSTINVIDVGGKPSRFLDIRI